MGKVKNNMPPGTMHFADEYYMWLCDLIKMDTITDKSYWLLIKTLHKKEYYWSVPNDDNRALDGKKMRGRFVEEVDHYSFDYVDDLDGPCTMLEMLIALACRMEYAMADPDKGDRTHQWFWEILTNIGLDKYTDDAYVDLSGPFMVDQILNNVLDRTYKKCGTGGLFPLKEPKKDQRKVEIWYQMSTYLVEKCYVDS